MPNITLSVNEQVIKKVRRIAMDRNTTLTAMVRQFLEDVASRTDLERQLALSELRESFRDYSRPMGVKTWTREDLHER